MRQWINEKTDMLVMGFLVGFASGLLVTVWYVLLRYERAY